MNVTTAIRVTLLSATTSMAAAQNNHFQLPRECSERHNVDHSKCVIPDGQPSYPWVHRVQPVPPTVIIPAPMAPAPPAAVLAPARKAR